MNSAILQSEQPVSTRQLRSIFDQSLAVLCEGNDVIKVALETGKAHNARLRRQTLPLRIDVATLRERALDQAAKALATLWKISGP